MGAARAEVQIHKNWPKASTVEEGPRLQDKENTKNFCCPPKKFSTFSEF